MKKKIYAALLIAMMTVTLLSGCQSAARNWGGTVKIELEPGQKLEMITWKGDSLWYLTRPMRAGEEAETHTFNERSEFGVLEGTVIVIESAKTAAAAGYPAK